MSSRRSDAVLDLGTQLATHLGAKNDLLASWMAHYIAELIDNVEKATAEDRQAAQERCAKAILKLWRHRAMLDGKARPFAELDPIVKTLASLDIEGPAGRYLARGEFDDVEEPGEVRQWLEFARDVDEIARSLIRTAIRSAGRSAASSVSPWVELARDAELLDGVEAKIARFILQADATGDEKQRRVATLQLRLTRIESFLSRGASLVERIRVFLADEEGKGSEDEASENS